MLLSVVAGSIVWAAPPTCPTQEDVAARIAALAPNADVADIDVDAKVREEAGAWIVELELRVEEERFARRLEAERCTVLAEAVALVVATTADPLGSAIALREVTTVAATPSAGVTPPEPAAIDEEIVAVEPAPVAAREPPPPIVIGVGVGAGLELGALPGVTGSASGAIAVERDRLRFEVGGAYFIPRRAELADGRGATVGLGAAVLRGCGRLGARRLFVLCLGAEVGAMRGSARGIADGQSKLEPWAAALGSAGVLGEVAPRVRLFARGEVGLAFVRPSFQLRPPADEAIVLHAPGLVSARATVGIEIAFSVTKPKGGRE